ncbi:hypothetical protein [Bowdeniella massiliensis]|uniref:hypothetical protein n=1 Tax=Bowdeniella massiliensis TaxID=2932264 RepID=UPI002027F293|nr:hypothetical protein [Bowdeniella massiliensis]
MKSLAIRALAWALFLGLVIGYMALIVHRGRSGQVPWGIGLSWLLAAAGGINVGAGKGSIPGIVYSVTVVAVPALFQLFGSTSVMLTANDWRSLTWYIGLIVVVTLTALFSSRVRLAKEKPELWPYDEKSQN